jgi:peptide deformylase
MIKEIVTDIKALRKPSELVTKDDDIKSIIADLKDTLEHLGHGYALAGSQIGIYKQIFYCKIPKDVDEQTKEVKYIELTVINPEITFKEQKIINYHEGCLSFPGVRLDTDRCYCIAINYEDENLKKTTMLADGIRAMILQHEIDHLRGILIFDKRHRDVNRRK